MAKAKSESKPESQAAPEAEAQATPPAEQQVQPQATVQSSAPATQVILSRGPSQSAIRREKLGFNFTDGKKEVLADGTVIYRH